MESFLPQYEFVDVCSPPNSPADSMDDGDWVRVTIGTGSYLVNDDTVKRLEFVLTNAQTNGEASYEGMVDVYERLKEDAAKIYLEHMGTKSRPIPVRSSCSGMFDSRIY